MKKNLVLLALGALTFASCQTQPKEDYSWIKKGLDVASAQLTLTAEEISSTNMLPRSIRTGYDMDFLCRQLERGEETFKDSLRAHPAADNWENAAYAAFMTGPAVSTRALYGMLTN